MLKFDKIFNKKYIPFVILFIILIGLYVYSNKKYNIVDKMTTGESGNGSQEKENKDNNKDNNQYTMQPVANPSDLLPKDLNSQWASLNPISQGNVAIPDLLQSGFHIGLDSIGQTLKNANLQSRPDPIIERKPTGIWNQSTIEPDYARVQ